VPRGPSWGESSSLVSFSSASFWQLVWQLGLSCWLQEVEALELHPHVEQVELVVVAVHGRAGELIQLVVEMM